MFNRGRLEVMLGGWLEMVNRGWLEMILGSWLEMVNRGWLAGDGQSRLVG